MCIHLSFKAYQDGSCRSHAPLTRPLPVSETSEYHMTTAGPGNEQFNLEMGRKEEIIIFIIFKPLMSGLKPLFQKRLPKVSHCKISGHFIFLRRAQCIQITNIE